MKFLEVIYLVLAVGIVVNEAVWTQSLSTEEVALVALLFGLLASSVADRTGNRGPSDFIRDVMGALRGNGGGGGGGRRNGG